MRIIQETNKKLIMNKNIKRLRSKKKVKKRKQKKKKPVVIDKINERKKERNLRIYAKHERKTKELNK